MIIKFPKRPGHAELAPIIITPGMSILVQYQYDEVRIISLQSGNLIQSVHGSVKELKELMEKIDIALTYKPREYPELFL